ncbi:CoaE-domain-containing protein [Aureobasidium subglaciale]|nr:CoaE-domain-containing protein [Aureobasidium subglaciale]
MLLLGLTGSIATGKSTVSRILSAHPYSLPIVDADLIARQVVEPGTAGYNQIVSHFGPSTPDLLIPADASSGGENGPDGKGRPLNRPALGRRVFGEGKESDRKVLNSIVHPAVRREIYKQMLSAYLKGHWACVLDIPLLYESVNGMCLSRGEKSGVVVWNDGDQEQLKREIDRVMEVVRAGSPSWWSWLLLLCPPLAVASGTLSYLNGVRMKKSWENEKVREKAKL